MSQGNLFAPPPLIPPNRAGKEAALAKAPPPPERAIRIARAAVDPLGHLSAEHDRDFCRDCAALQAQGFQPGTGNCGAPIDHSGRRVVVSLGAGVQSSALVLMAARGEIQPMPDCAIFADTGDESDDTYRHLAWLKGEGAPWDGGEYNPARLPFLIHIARAWEGYGKPSIRGPLGDEILAATRGDGKAGSHSRPPFFVANGDGTGGIIRRQCTGDFKIDVIQAKERELLGLRKRQRWPKEIRIEQWIGISRDEASRMTPIYSRGPEGAIPHPSIRARWPLIEAELSRTDCERWLTSSRYPIPPKSACTFCPFHSDAEWRRIRDKDPKGWARAVEVDTAIRGGLRTDSLRGALFLHRSLKPLEEVDLSTAEERGQLNLFENECTGMCGV